MIKNQKKKVEKAYKKKYIFFLKSKNNSLINYQLLVYEIQHLYGDLILFNKIEYRKISGPLNKTCNLPSKYITMTYVEINYELRGTVCSAVLEVIKDLKLR